MNNYGTKRQQTAQRSPLIGLITALGTAFTLALPHAAHAQGVTPPPVPENIRVEEGQAFLLGRGVGTQNYICLPSPSVGQVEWTLFTPEATLFSDEAEQLTTHFFSPNPFEPSPSPFENGIVRAAWQDSRDTSTVWGRVVAFSSDSNFVAPGAIPWLKIVKAGDQAGPTGGETLSVTTFIQRLNTVGGAAPSTGCDLPTDIGRKAFVPYTADYFFYKQ